MKTNILRVTIALVLALSLGMVMAAPAAASPGTLNVYPFVLGTKDTGATAQWSTTQAKNGSYSAYLDTGSTGAGNEGRIVITMPAGTTLNDLTSISWWVYAASGYPPHLDITLDCDGDSVVDPEDMLTAEMNLNCVGAPKSIATLTSEISYNTGWLRTFELTSGDGFGAITDSTIFWVTKLGSGDLNAPSGTLGQWKSGIVAVDPESEMTTPVIDGTAPVVKLEIEVDRWVVNSDSYVDDVTINGVVWYGLIQDAIGSASAGDTINVKAGTYTESLSINKGLTIKGAGSGTTTITGVHTVSASSVSLADFTLTLSGSGLVLKIDSSAAALSNISVTNCVFNMSTSPSIGVSIGYGIGSSPKAVSNVAMDGNTFNGPADFGANPWKIGGQYGAPVGCQVTNVDFTNNTVNKCSTPINLQNQNITDILIDGNTFSSTDGVVYVWGEGTPTGVLSQFVFTNNDVSATNSYGVGIDLDGATVFGDANFGTGNRINYNDFSGVSGTKYGFGAVSLLSTLTSYTLDAEYNWYGGVAGPDHAKNPYNVQATSQGNAVVSDAVDFLPWMIHDTLVSGWNIWSTPIAPAAGLTGEPDTNTITEALDFWTADSTKVTAAYYFDSSTQAWAVATSLTPMQPVYLKLSAAATIDVCVSDSNNAPPARTMRVGWNLVGPADLDATDVVDALSSAYWGTGQASLVGYSYVISPSIHQTPWTYLRDTGGGVDLIPTEGYWVFMVNQGMLGGFTYTPITPLP